jgi:GT2 family glycosyltransferase
MLSRNSVTQSTSSVGIVVIGRNEGERLVRCLKSLVREDRPSVYVDSGSTDGSVQVAQSLGARVVDLDLSRKFTAARARNKGFEGLVFEHPELTYVQFVDGDCEVDPDWLDRARAHLETHPDVTVVCGRRRERFPEKSVYNRLCDLEWDTPVGIADSCGGDALMRVDAFRAAGGFREGLIAGEEPELCFRLRRAGGKIERLDAEMTLHDAAMTEASQWFKRAKRAGHAYAERAALHGREPGRPGVKHTASNLVWGLGVPLAVGAATATAGPMVGSFGGVSAYSYLFYKSYRSERKRRNAGDALLFAASCVASKFPEAMGAVGYLTNRLRGRESQLIEYKTSEVSSPRNAAT